MKSLALKIPILSSFIAFAFGFVVYEAFFSGESDLLNRAIVEWGWCSKDSASCLIKNYVCFGVGIFIVGVIIQVIFDWRYGQNLFRKNIAPSVPLKDFKNETPKELSFVERQKKAIEEISQLVGVAVDKSMDFADGIVYPNEPNLGEQCISTRKSGKKLMEYFKTGNNRLYFSDKASKNITELYELISICTQNMHFAINGIFQPDLWSEYSKKLKRAKTLKDEIDSEFREFLARH